ncbi:MAG: LptF/LptG family permease [bacterium]
MSLLTRYVLKNFLESFLIGFIIFCFIILLTSQLYQVIRWLVDGVYGIWDVIKYVVYISPMYLNYVVPVSIVFGVVSSVGKLSSNFELIAINSFGISLIEVFKKIFIAVFLLSILLFVFNEFLGYRFVSKALDMYYSASKNLSGSIKDYLIVWDNNEETNYVFAKEYLGDLGLMKDVFIVVKDKRSKSVKRNLVSDFAKKKGENVWLLYNVVMYNYVDGSKVSIGYMDYVFDLGQDGGRKRHREEISVLEIMELINQYKVAGLRDLVFEMYMKLNLKFVFPLSGLFLLFLIFPFSVSKVRVSNFLGIAFSIGVAIFYYIFITLAQVFSTKTGIIWFLWLPNLISIFLGGFLMFLKNKNDV